MDWVQATRFYKFLLAAIKGKEVLQLKFEGTSNVQHVEGTAP
jgi:hypothetical protein